MKVFLKRVAEHIRQKFGNELPRICVVLPNRRAGLYLKHYLSEQAEKPFWAPQVYSVEDLLFSMTDLQKADKFQLILHLFKIYKMKMGQGSEPFKAFMRWAEPLLDDFNDLDYYLADTDAVFSYLSDARAIEQWNPEGQELSTVQRSYLEFYRSLEHMHKALSEKMLKDGLAWPGLAAKLLSQKLDGENLELEWDYILFAGLNAISPAEQAVIDKLSMMLPSDVLWDADTWYMRDEQQEAGHFLRKHKMRSKGPFLWEEDILTSKQAKIKLWGVPGGVGQAKLAGEILGKWISEGREPDRNTAVVLADEGLLLPVLNSVPREIEFLNVTMGISLDNSPVYQFFMAWVRVFEEAEKTAATGNSPKKGSSYRLKTLMELFAHPWMGLFDNEAGDGIDKLRKWAYQMYHNNGFAFVGITALQEKVDDFLGKDRNLSALLFPSEAGPEQLITTALAVIDHMRKAPGNSSEKEEGSREIDAEHLFIINQVWTRLQDIMNEMQLPEDVNTLRIVLERLVSSHRLPLSGEPLKGLQLMGMLETRALDFDRVILLSANEGKLPSGGNMQSFIPMDVRKTFELPGNKERNAVTAYHFWRLLQQAEEIHILYNTEVGKLGGGEQSRFLHQLRFELAKLNHGLEISEVQSGLIPDIHSISPIAVEKDAVVMQRLQEVAQAGLSPSALNKYRECPLKFFLSRMERLDPNEEDPEDYGALEVGNFVHRTLELLFTPYIGTKLDEGVLSTMIGHIDRDLLKAYAELFPGRNESLGKGLLLYHQGKEIVQHYLQSERKRLSKLSNKPVIQALEEESIREYTFSGSDGALKSVFLRGKADRIDRTRDTLHIMDYKTAKVEAKDIRIDDLEILAGTKGAKAFQLMVYGLLFGNDGEPPVQLSIVSMRNLKGGPVVLTMNKEDQIGKQTMLDFMAYLDHLLGELFDPDIPFGQTDEHQHCEYCDFQRLCYRGSGKR